MYVCVHVYVHVCVLVIVCVRVFVCARVRVRVRATWLQNSQSTEFTLATSDVRIRK